jgi:hypothetical protein
MKSQFILADLFQDNMMFQYKQPMVFFGETKKSGNLEISVFNHTTLFSLEEGRFCVKIDHSSHTFDSFIVTLKFADEIITLQDCILGDIFFVSGQSNAQMTIKETSFHEPIANPLIDFTKYPNYPMRMHKGISLFLFVSSKMDGMHSRISDGIFSHWLSYRYDASSRSQSSHWDYFLQHGRYVRFFMVR